MVFGILLLGLRRPGLKKLVVVDWMIGYVKLDMQVWDWAVNGGR